MLFPNLNPSTRRGIVFVATLVVGGAVMWFVLSRLGTEAEVATAITDAERQELRDFETALRSDSAEWAARRGGRWQGGDDALHTGGELFAFDHSINLFQRLDVFRTTELNLFSPTAGAKRISVDRHYELSQVNQSLCGRRRAFNQTRTKRRRHSSHCIAI